MEAAWIDALIGGILIGISVSLMLLWNGRVTGISGIIYGGLHPTKGDFAWRGLFVAGLILGGLALQSLKPEIFNNELQISLTTTVMAGLLVGFGTVLGSGCTSGHGICGISRLSPRSLVATVLFVLTGILTVTLIKALGVSL